MIEAKVGSIVKPAKYKAAKEGKNQINKLVKRIHAE